MTDENKPVSKKPLRVSKAPPPEKRVCGGGYIPKPSNNDRLPRWSKWRLMPEVKEWEAVALSLNIEPEKIKTDRNAWMGADHPFVEGDEFNDRLEILKKHSHNRTYFPTPCTLDFGRWYKSEKRLDEFAAWCAHVGFEIPPELTALAKAAPQAAPLVEASPTDDPDEKSYTDEANRNGGRYQLAVAAMFIASRANAGVNSMTRKLFEAAGVGELIVYERGMDEVYRFTPEWKSNFPLKDNEAFLEAKWNDLNAWLKIKEPGIFKAYRFPDPDAPVDKVEAVLDTTRAQVTQNKLRRNNLDPAIDKAIKQAKKMELADVYLELKELVLVRVENYPENIASAR